MHIPLTPRCPSYINTCLCTRKSTRSNDTPAVKPCQPSKCHCGRDGESDLCLLPCPTSARPRWARFPAPSAAQSDLANSSQRDAIGSNVCESSGPPPCGNADRVTPLQPRRGQEQRDRRGRSGGRGLGPTSRGGPSEPQRPPWTSTAHPASSHVPREGPSSRGMSTHPYPGHHAALKRLGSLLWIEAERYSSRMMI